MQNHMLQPLDKIFYVEVINTIFCFITVYLLFVYIFCIHFSGDCCSRATVIGACLGAKFGIEGIPIEWIDRVDGIEDLIAKSIKVFS